MLTKIERSRQKCLLLSSIFNLSLLSLFHLREVSIPLPKSSSWMHLRSPYFLLMRHTSQIPVSVPVTTLPFFWSLQYVPSISQQGKKVNLDTGQSFLIEAQEADEMSQSLRNYSKNFICPIFLVYSAEVADSQISARR